MFILISTAGVSGTGAEEGHPVPWVPYDVTHYKITAFHPVCQEEGGGLLSSDEVESFFIQYG